MRWFKPKRDPWAETLARHRRFYEKHKNLPREVRLQLAVEQGLISYATLRKLNEVQRQLRLVVDNDA